MKSRAEEATGLPLETLGGTYSVKVTSPSGGEKWHVGETHTITWDISTGIDKVKIYIQDNTIGGSAGVNYITPNNMSIATSGTSGSYSWTIDSKQLPVFPGYSYQIRVDAVDNNGNVLTVNGTEVRSFSNILSIDSLSSIYRFWSDKKQGHFFTINQDERDFIIANDPSWKYENIAYSAFSTETPGATPIYRFWSNKKQHHFFTISQAERDSIIANDKSWSYEGVAFYAYSTQQANTTPVYRFWSDKKQGHFFTVSQAEKDSIIANDKSWKYEGIAYYVPTN